MLSLRSNEWGRAVWELQKNHLMTGDGLDWRYIAFADPQDSETMCNLESMRSYMAGVIMEAIASTSVVLV